MSASSTRGTALLLIAGFVIASVTSNAVATTEFSGAGTGTIGAPAPCVPPSGTDLCASGDGTYVSDRLGNGTFHLDGRSFNCRAFTAEISLLDAAGDEMILEATARIASAPDLCSLAGTVEFDATFFAAGVTGALASLGGGGEMTGSLITLETGGWDIDFAWSGRLVSDRVEFDGDGSGALGGVSPCPPDGCVSGLGTHRTKRLGSGSFVLSVRLHPLPSTAAGQPCREFSLNADFAGEDGDHIFLRGTGVVTGADDFCKLRPVAFQGTFAIIGGTGELAAATGGGNFEGVGASGGDLAFVLDGVIGW